MLGMAAERRLRKKRKTTSVTSPTEMRSVLLGVAERGADRLGAVERDLQIDVARQRRGHPRQFGFDRVNRVDDVGARLAVEDHQDRRLAVGEAGVAQVLDGIDDLADIGQFDRGVVAIGDNEAAILLGLARLIVGVDLPVERVVFDGALRAVGVGRGERRAHVLEAHAIFEERLGIELDAHGRQRAPADVDLADALELRQALLHHIRGGVIELTLRPGRRGQRDDHDRRIGRIDLVIGRIGAKARRQVGARGVDRRLDVARSAVDVAIEAELQRDARVAERARRGHFRDVGDLAQMFLERRGDAGGHCVRVRAGHRRLHRDGRKIDLRQGRDRQ